jgi:hypothetical protein
MGFPDEKRNSTVLKGLNGNLDRTVEALIRLGEQNPGKSRGSTPTPPAKPSSNGLSFDTAPAATASTNPFDALDAIAAPPQHSQQPQPAPLQAQQPSYEGFQAQTVASSNSYNPFLSQAQQAPYQQHNIPQQQQNYNYQQNPFGQQQDLEQSFQGLQLSNQQQCHRYLNNTAPSSHHNRNISLCLHLQVQEIHSLNHLAAKCFHLRTRIHSASNLLYNRYNNNKHRTLT